VAERVQHPDAVPFAEHATADPRKFTDYLLNPEHPDGRGKAKFFEMNGYTADNWEDLWEEIARELPYIQGTAVRENPVGGVNWRADVPIKGCAGTVDITTIWDVFADTPPRLITAYPVE
jgi:hypothetical protein